MGRSDGGIATVRIDFLYEDLDNVNNVIEISPEEENIKRSVDSSSRMSKGVRDLERSVIKESPQGEKQRTGITKVPSKDSLDDNIVSVQNASPLPLKS